MNTEARFNLIDEPWIPIVDIGNVSLQQLFTEQRYRALGGNPVQKIALTKLLLAIAQAAYTPEDDEDWSSLGAMGMAEKCVAYLKKWHDRFWLYGEKPFLQMPKIATAEIQQFGAVLLGVSTGNTTVLTETQVEKNLSDAEKALLIISLMGFGLGVKKTDNSVVLSHGYCGKTNEKGKPSSAKFGPSIGYMGFMHSFLLGDSIWQTLWFNLFTAEQLKQLSTYPNGLGIAPWEQMPDGEYCEAARALQKSLMGRLVPLSRFCLLIEHGLHYSEGIAHDGYKEGLVDPSMAVKFSGKDPKVIWIDPEKRPWRYLTALLSFIASGSGSDFDCFQVRLCLGRARPYAQALGIWSGGLRVSSNAGEQFVSGTDDFVESNVILDSENLGKLWFEYLSSEMEKLNDLSKTVYSATLNYFKKQKMDGDDKAKMASNLFWQLCEHKFEDLLVACNPPYQLKPMRKVFAHYARQVYDHFCPKNTARQLDTWAECQPNLKQYFS